MAEPSAPEPRDPLRVVAFALQAATVLAVIGLVVYLFAFVQHQRETSECYQQAFGELNSSLQVSRDAARQDRDQLRQLVTALLSDTGPGDTRAVLQRYLDVSNAAETDRSQAPLPTRTCG